MFSWQIVQHVQRYTWKQQSGLNVKKSVMRDFSEVSSVNVCPPWWSHHHAEQKTAMAVFKSILCPEFPWHTTLSQWINWLINHFAEQRVESRTLCMITMTVLSCILGHCLFTVRQIIMKLLNSLWNLLCVPRRF